VSSPAAIQSMATHGPVALLQLDNCDGQPRKLPLELVEDWGDEDLEQGRNKDDMLPLVADMTQDVACALFEFTLLPNSTMPLPVVAHVKSIVRRIRHIVEASKPRGDPQRLQLKIDALLDVLRENSDLLKALLHNQELQDILREERVRRNVEGLYRMNKAGRSYIKDDPKSKEKAALVLLSVKNNAD
jgi:hypothetical protein